MNFLPGPVVTPTVSSSLQNVASYFSPDQFKFSVTQKS
jgi:hypothetical protein